jgi:propanol-preferring alcohol dehydrogenase
MLFKQRGKPLHMVTLKPPIPGPGQLLLQAQACGVCRTDLHIIDAELSKPKLPLIIGHEIVSTVLQIGEGVKGF